MCYYERTVSQRDSISRKVRCIAKIGSDRQISISGFNVVSSQLVDQKLPKLQQDKRIYHKHSPAGRQYCRRGDLYTPARESHFDNQHNGVHFYAEREEWIVTDLKLVRFSSGEVRF